VYVDAMRGVSASAASVFCGPVAADVGTSGRHGRAIATSILHNNSDDEYGRRHSSNIAPHSPVGHRTSPRQQSATIYTQQGSRKESDDWTKLRCQCIRSTHCVLQTPPQRERAILHKAKSCCTSANVVHPAISLLSY
jgi:hypothetical protein